jgi:hypothetical protein
VISFLIHTLVFLSDDTRARRCSIENAQSSAVSETCGGADRSIHAWRKVVGEVVIDVKLGIGHTDVCRGLKRQLLDTRDVGASGKGRIG